MSKGTKTVNINSELHQRIKRAAVDAATPLGVYTEALLVIGLGRERDVKRFLAERTKLEQPQEKAV